MSDLSDMSYQVKFDLDIGQVSQLLFLKKKSFSRLAREGITSYKTRM